jgi:hypothetical protein
MGEIGKFLNDVGVFLGGLAAILVGLGVTGTKVAKLIKPGNRSVAGVLRALWKSSLARAALTVALIGGLILVARPLIPAPCGTVRVSITSPTNGMMVNESQPVLGTINHLCSDQHLWLVLQPVNGGYYPQQEVAAGIDTGRWSVAAYFGRPSKTDNAIRFNLLAAVADNSTNQYFQAYLASGKAAHNYPALGTLDNATVLSLVTVNRRSYRGP